MEPDELIVPAVQGTTGILKSAQKYGTSVKRVVITSSCAAVLTPTTEPRVFSEANWNEASIQEVKEKGRDAAGPAKYRASKTLAEKAAWEFYEQNKASLPWDLVVLNPPFVYGPIMHECGAPEELNQSMRDWYRVIVEGKIDNETLVNGGCVVQSADFGGIPMCGADRGLDVRHSRAMYVDVRDIAQAHTLALLKPEAGDNRFIISAGPYKWQDFGQCFPFSEQK